MMPGWIAVCSWWRLAGGAYWTLATYPSPFLEPFPFIGGGAHRPLTTLCPPSPCLDSCLAWPYLPTHPSLPLVGCANAVPRLSLVHCSVSYRVHTEEGNCPRCWPGASKWKCHAGMGGALPNSGLWAPGCPLAGSLPQRGHITTFSLSFPVLSPPCGEHIMCPQPPPPRPPTRHPPLGPWCVYCMSIPSSGGGGWGGVE